MDKVAGLPDAQRNELFTETAAQRGMTTAVVEKDFWGHLDIVPGANWACAG